MRFNRDQAEDEKQAAAMGIKNNPWAIRTTLTGSHFNPSLNRCFMKTEARIVMNADLTITTKVIFDAYEDVNVAEYIWQTEKDKKYWEVAPKVCRVKTPSGEEKKCQSEGEFNSLADPYIASGLTPN